MEENFGNLFFIFVGDSEDSIPNPQAVSEDDSEMNCSLASLVERQSLLQEEQSPLVNGLLALLEKKSTKSTGPEVHKDVSELLSVFLTKGVDLEARKLALEAYPLLQNCSALKPPEINPEIKACLTSQVLRQDIFLVKLQVQLATILSALAVPFNKQYELMKTSQSPEVQQELEKLGDPLKLTADIFYSLSCHRRFLIMPFLDSSVKDILENCPVDTLLFGQNFTDQLKTSKEAKRFGATLKKKPKVWKPPLSVAPVAGPSSAAQPLAGPSRRPQNQASFLATRRTFQKTRYKKEEEGRRRRREQYHR